MFLVLVAACGANGGKAAPDRAGDTTAAAAAADTLRGVIDVTGSDPMTTVVLRRADGSTVAIRGPLADTLRRASGLDVRLAGEPDGGAFEARSFRVRGMQGLYAADGRLEIDGDVAVLVTADGSRLRYPLPPEALRAMAGRHVWIAGSPGAEPEHWGAFDGR